MGWILIAAIAAAGVGVTRWYRRSGDDPSSTYSEADRQRIRATKAQNQSGHGGAY